MPLSTQEIAPFKSIIDESKKSLLPVAAEDSGSESLLNYPLLLQGCLLKDLENAIADLEKALDTATSLDELKIQFSTITKAHYQIVKETALSPFASSKNPANECYDQFFKALNPDSNFKTYLNIMTPAIDKVVIPESRAIRQPDKKIQFVLNIITKALTEDLEIDDLPIDNPVAAVITDDRYLLNVELVRGTYETFCDIYRQLSKAYPRLYDKLKQHNEDLNTIFDKIEKLEGHGITLYDAITNLTKIFDRGGERITGNQKQAALAAEIAEQDFRAYLASFPDPESIQKNLKSANGKSLGDALAELSSDTAVRCIEMASAALKLILKEGDKSILGSSPTLTPNQREEAIKEIKKLIVEENLSKLRSGKGELTTALPSAYIKELASKLKIKDSVHMGDLLANFEDIEIYKILVEETIKNNNIFTSPKNLGEVFLFLNVTQCNFLCQALGDKLSKIITVKNGIYEAFEPMSPEQCNIVMTEFLKQMSDEDLKNLLNDHRSLGDFFSVANEAAQIQILDLLGNQRVLDIIQNEHKIDLSRLTIVLKPLKPDLKKRVLTLIGDEQLLLMMMNLNVYEMSRFLAALDKQQHTEIIDLLGQERLLTFVQTENNINLDRVTEILRPLNTDNQKKVRNYIGDKRLLLAITTIYHLANLLIALDKQQHEEFLNLFGNDRILTFIQHDKKINLSNLASILKPLNFEMQKKVYSLIADSKSFMPNYFELSSFLRSFDKEMRANQIEMLGRDRIINLISDADDINITKLTNVLKELKRETQKIVLSYIENEKLFSAISSPDNLNYFLRALDGQQQLEIIDLFGKDRILTLIQIIDEINLSNLTNILDNITPDAQDKVFSFIEDKQLFLAIKNYTDFNYFLSVLTLNRPLQTKIMGLIGEKGILNLVQDENKINLTKLAKLLKSLDSQKQEKILVYLGDSKTDSNKEFTADSKLEDLLAVLDQKRQAIVIKTFGQDRILKLIQDDNNINITKLSAILKILTQDMQDTVLAFIGEEKLRSAITTHSALETLFFALTKEKQAVIMTLLGKEHIIKLMYDNNKLSLTHIINTLRPLKQSPELQKSLLNMIDTDQLSRPNLLSLIDSGSDFRLLLSVLDKDISSEIKTLVTKEMTLKWVKSTNDLVSILQSQRSEKQEQLNTLQLFTKDQLMQLQPFILHPILEVLKPDLQSGFFNKFSEVDLLKIIDKPDHFICTLELLNDKDRGKLLKTFKKAALLKLTGNSTLIPLIIRQLGPQQKIDFIKELGWKDFLAYGGRNISLQYVFEMIPLDQRVELVTPELLQNISLDSLIDLFRILPKPQHASIVQALKKEMLKDMDHDSFLQLVKVIDDPAITLTLIHIIPKKIITKIIPNVSSNVRSAIVKLIDAEILKEMSSGDISNLISIIEDTDKSKIVNLLNETELLDKFTDKYFNSYVNTLLEQLNSETQVKFLEMLGSERLNTIISNYYKLEETLMLLSANGKLCLIRLLGEYPQNIITSPRTIIDILSNLPQESRLLFLKNLGKEKLIEVFYSLRMLSSDIEQLKNVEKADVASELLQALGTDAMLLFTQHNQKEDDKTKPCPDSELLLGVYDKHSLEKFFTELKEGILKFGSDHVLLISGMPPSKQTISISYTYGEWTFINPSLHNPAIISTKDIALLASQIFSMVHSQGPIALATKICLPQSTYNNDYYEVPPKIKAIKEQQAGNAIINYGLQKLKEVAPDLVKTNWKDVMKNAFTSKNTDFCKRLIQAGINFYTSDINVSTSTQDSSEVRESRERFNTLCESQAQFNIEKLKEKILTTNWDVKIGGKTIINPITKESIQVPITVKLEWEKIIAAESHKNYYSAWHEIINLAQSGVQSNKYVFFPQDPAKKHYESVIAETIVPKL